jgi:hypothetical protein
LPQTPCNARRQGRGGRRPARCAGLRRHRPAAPCRPRPAVPGPAAARCLWTAMAIWA